MNWIWLSCIIAAAVMGYLLRSEIAHQHRTYVYGIYPDGRWDYLGAMVGEREWVKITNWRGGYLTNDQP